MRFFSRPLALAHIPWLPSLLLLTSCETLIDADFDRRFAKAGSCFPECPPEQRCDLDRLECVCAPAGCDEGRCGALLDSRCGQPIDCGECPGGGYCGSETPNVCSDVPCVPQTCEQLGQTSGVHATCGILIDCNPVQNCTCPPGEVCSAAGCCAPFEHPANMCGFLENGCGQQQEQSCTKGTEFVCQDGTCCDPPSACDGSGCGPTAACGGYIDCFGTCPDGKECVREDGPFPRHRCGQCTPACPADAVCGLNEDQGCPGESILCPGTCPDGQICRVETFSCCTPHCPGMPTTCGQNPDGCGRTIQCPGPCPVGQTCRSRDDGTFTCEAGG